MKERPADIARPIVILGSARTGTSLTAGLLATQGVWTGPTREANSKNPKGFWENHNLYHHRGDVPADPEIVAHDLRRQGYRGGAWLIKHSPGGWQGWLAMDPLFVLVRRDVEPTLASQMKWQPGTKTREQRRGLIAKQQRELDYVRDTFGGIDFWPQEIVGGDWAPFYWLCHSLGLGPVNQHTAERFVDPQLWNREYAQRRY